jgi:hypothetical protein
VAIAPKSRRNPSPAQSLFPDRRVVCDFRSRVRLLALA